MSSGYPIDPELAAVLDAAMTIAASPGLVEDHTRPDIGPIAVLTMTPSISVHTSDDRAGAELVVLVASSLLGCGFDLVTAIEAADLAGLPLLPDWRVMLDAAGRLLEIHEPGAGFYDGDLGESTPPGWHARVRRRGRVVLVGGTLALDMGDRYAQLSAASRAGEIVGAQLALT